MKSLISLLFLFSGTLLSAQKVSFEALLNDKISIRALEIWDGRVWYSGTDSKFGYIDLKNSKNQKQIKLSEKKLQFRTLAQDKDAFYTINIESPAIFFRIDKKSLESEIVKIDSAKNAFYDALHFNKDKFYTFSDPEDNLEFKMGTFSERGEHFNYHSETSSDLLLNKGEAAFAASNTNISSSGNFVWIATGGRSSRIFRLNVTTQNFEIFKTPFIQGEDSQGIYSVDFYKDKFGIAVGGDYTKQDAAINNVATSIDGGETWQIRASGQNAGYMTCVKIKPGSKGKEIIAVGDQHISYSSDFGKTWKKISNEKGFFVCKWIDRNTVVLAGKDRISLMKLNFR